MNLSTTATTTPTKVRQSLIMRQGSDELLESDLPELHTISDPMMAVARQMFDGYLECDLHDQEATREVLYWIVGTAAELTAHPHDVMGRIVDCFDQHRHQLRRHQDRVALLYRIVDELLCELLPQPLEPSETMMRLHQAYLTCDLSDRRAARELVSTIFEEARRLTRHPLRRPYDTPSWIVCYVNQHQYQLRRPRGTARLLESIAEALGSAFESEPLAA